MDNLRRRFGQGARVDNDGGSNSGRAQPDALSHISHGKCVSSMLQKHFAQLNCTLTVTVGLYNSKDLAVRENKSTDRADVCSGRIKINFESVWPQRVYHYGSGPESLDSRVEQFYIANSCGCITGL